ncbi:OTU domain-containing protein 7B-like [Condylostylus longicornis]|uniref:OTU domain-containing protein 7B-like n=1 Tax=Condylostylus longicornis TaxID=2530218 RepID=UPI00244DE8C9|nr:OTU domain-containing protein 7B-like [Condylostylus longicornis]XP_055385884.1 OTU domain-containing protein 7B-like [Condylostylus longicornis]
MNESRLISEFMSLTGANPNDAMQCLRAWDWDLKRAITDYNDTCHFDYRTTASDLDNFRDDSSRNLIDLNNDCNNSTSDNNKPNKIVILPQSSLIPSIGTQSQTSGIEKRPILSKTDSIDVVDCRKLSRGISRATDNINLVSKARTEIAMDFRGNNSNNSHLKKNQNLEQQISNNSLDTPDFTFILPNIYNYKDSFRVFLEKDLIECSTLQALEQSHRLNWWVDHGLCRKLWPLATTGDGNCLLHAASLGMWGFHDRKLTLRKALHGILSNGKCRDALWRRWRFQQTRLNRRAGFVYSEIEWAKEWDELISMSSPEPRNSINVRRRFSTSTDRHSLISSESIDDSATYESLEEIHILALAHVLRRTIIVISDTVLKDLNGEAMAPITFGGVYLPFEINSTECNRGPLLLAYDMAHFSALVPMETGSEYPPALIPLVDYENVLLPVQFCIDPGENFNWTEYDGAEGNWALSEREQMALLKEYLDIVYATNSTTPDEDVFEDLTDDEYEKKFVESEIVIPQQQHHPSNQYNLVADEPHQSKSKAAKQLQSVAKQFGSIGKSMSKKIKKNIGSITKIGNKSNGGNKLKNTLSSGSSTQSFTCTRLLCAKLRIKRHEYQEEMIRNYLECARTRYLDLEKNRDKIGSAELDRQQLEMLQLSEPDIGVVYCVNIGCNNFANSETSYLCYECYEKQKQRESNSTYLSMAPRYGTGKSKFYTQADMQAHESIKNLPPAKRLNDLDQTLYLSNSTFFNDNNLLKSGGSSSNSSTNSCTSLSNSANNASGVNSLNNVNNSPNLTPATSSTGNNLVNRESSNRYGYSPTVRLIDEEQEEFNKPTGTVSVFSPGNTISTSNLNGNNGNNNNTSNNTNICNINHSFKNNVNNNTNHAPVTRIIKIELEGEPQPILTSNRNHLTTTEFDTKPCKTLGCNFYGTLSTNFYCSKCYQQMIKNKNDTLIDLSSPLPQSATATSNNIIKTTTTTSAKPTTIYPTATATITKTGNKIMSDI